MSMLGLDIGTTGCKAMVVSAGGGTIAFAYREYPLLYPGPGRVELDPMTVWHAIRECIREAAGKSSGSVIKAMSISSHGESITPLAADGRILSNTIVSLDKRAISVMSHWVDGFGQQRVETITGIPLHQKHSINRIMWLRDHNPRVFREAARFLCYEDFAVFMLGLEPAISYPLAARTMAFDPLKKQWSREILDFAGIDESRLARTVPSGTPLEVIPPAICAGLGLNPGVLLVSGGHDQPCSALGAGAVEPGQAIDSIGTVEALSVVLPENTSRSILLAAGYPVYPHVVPGLSVTMAVNPNAGSLLRWYRDELAAAETASAQASGQDPYDLIIEASQARETSVVVIPHFSGSGTPNPNPGLKGSIVGLDLGVSRHDIARAILESQAFELKRNRDALARAGIACTDVRAVGGGAASRFMLQLRADVLDQTITVPATRESGCLGAALLAGFGAGLFPSIEKAASQLVRTKEVILPEAASQPGLQRKYQDYHQLCPDMNTLISPGGEQNEFCTK